ncbi:hypothetical protein [Algoriphagus resistens]|uniref:hypothetical protein n=1 Tax=Algoriphagus resistens TaxID=1750590 RepID=UPI0007169AD3|nr:hypothetical protein [Algoriphagus resistens]
MSKLKPNQFEIRPGVIITERPILFNTEMVQANLEGRKTQTRRTKGLDKYPDYNWQNISSVNGTDIKCAMADTPDRLLLVRSPYGQPGDLIWVRESFTIFLDGILFKSRESIFKNPKWRPSIHMPKSYAQIWAMVEDIRVEKLLDISPKDAISEGIEVYYTRNKVAGYKNYLTTDPKYFSSPRFSFFSLIDKVNNCQMASINPWVWVVKYRILSKEGRPTDEIIWDNYRDIQYRISCPESYKGKEASNV